jgi:hypothetical protein
MSTGSKLSELVSGASIFLVFGLFFYMFVSWVSGWVKMTVLIFSGKGRLILSKVKYFFYMCFDDLMMWTTF